VRALKPSAKQLKVWDTSTPGFGVIVGRSKSFFVMYGPKRTVKVLGRFPDTPLSAARAAAKKLLAVNPRPTTALKFEKALELFLEEKAKARRPRTVQNLKARLTRHFPFKQQLADVTHEDILRKLAHIDTNAEHDHALSVAKTFFTWAYNHRYIDDNPTRGISLRGTQFRSRVLTDAELKLIWKATEGRTHFNRIVRLCLLTGQRRGEIAALRAEWVSDTVITLPSEITKNRRAHSFPIGPLSSSEIPLADSNSTGFIFPARRNNHPTPFNGWSKAKSALDTRCQIDRWTLHDLRRTYATKMAALGTPIHVTERLLNHVSGGLGGIVAVYNRHTYMDEMQAAVRRYEDWFASLIN
jgi:integrase